MSGAALTPGFIDAHMHLESTKLWIDEFVPQCRAWHHRGRGGPPRDRQRVRRRRRRGARPGCRPDALYIRHLRVELRTGVAVRELGVTSEAPFMQLSFLGLSVIPELRITDLGLVDVVAFELTSLAP